MGKFVLANAACVMQTRAVEDRTAGSREDLPLVIAALPINERERRIALGVVISLSSVAVAVAPFANMPLAHFDAFIPVLQTVMCVVDLITAALLFVQYSIYPKYALLAVASGYVFSGLFAFTQTLTFPGAYSATGLFGDALNSANWLFVFWHTTFPLGVIVYALSKDADQAAIPTGGSTAVTIVITLACVLAGIALLTWLATAGAGNLPSMYLSTNNQQTAFSTNANVFLWVLSIATIVLMFVRRRTILDLWLMVTLLAWWPHFIISIFVPVVRFSLGWYTARCLALVASSTLLCVLLAETAVLYRRLAGTVVLLRRERANRLMSLDAATSAMAHELKQPLTGIVTTGAAALRWLKRTPPDLEEVRTCIAKVIDSGHRADHIISSVRELFKKQGDHRTELYIHDVAKQALSLAQKDLQINGVSVSTQFQNNLPTVYADRTQLQQVILNLIRNAIDAMATPSLGTKSLRLATSLNGQSTVLLSVQDSGPGISPETAARIFEPFFTTKAAGMGLGLSICQTIVEDHGGNLRIAKTDSEGCVFEITLPIAAKTGRAVPGMQS